MTAPRRPAAYVLHSAASPTPAVMISAAHQRGWAEPEMYASVQDETGNDQGLAELACAIAAGRHDALLMCVPDLSDPAVLKLLRLCTKHGVSVSFVPPATEQVVAADQARTMGQLTLEPSREPWSTLTRARLEALTGLFPQWRIWLDHNGWHARRRDGHLQVFRLGAPTFHVKAETATELAAQLCWQQAADAHVPQGCASGKLAEDHGISFPAGTAHGD